MSYLSCSKVYDEVESADTSGVISDVRKLLRRIPSVPLGLESNTFIDGINWVMTITWVDLQPAGSKSGEEVSYS